MTAESLRQRLIAELTEKEGDRGYPTWWWAHSTRRGETTVAQARKELQQMEREGLVERASSQKNQIQWRRLTHVAAQ